MSESNGELQLDVHELVRKAIIAIERVFTEGDGRSMPTIEANAVSRDAAIRDAGDSVRDGLLQATQALNRIADELGETRRHRMTEDALARAERART